MAGRLALRRARKAATAGDSALAEGDLATAEEQFTSVVDRMREAVEDEDDARLAASGCVGLGRVCLHRNDLRTADQWFQQVQRLRPGAVDGYFWSGCASAHAGDYKRAEWCFGAALARDARFGRAYLQRAYVRLRLGRSGEALADLHAAGGCGVLDDRGRTIASVLLLRAGKPAQAEEHVLALSEDGRTPQAAAVLAIASHQQGKIDKACGAYIFALDHGVDTDAVLQGHASTTYLRGDYAASIRSWRTLSLRHPGNTTFVEHLALAQHRLAVQALTEENRPAASTALAEAAGTGEVDYADARAELRLHAAAEALENGDVDLAQRELTAAIRLRPGDRNALVWRAALHARSGDLDATTAAWEAVLGKAPGDRQARFGLALCEVERGRTDVAEQVFGELAGQPDDQVGSLAAQAVAGVHMRQGDWRAAAALVGAGTALHAECLYRAGDDEAVLALDDVPDVRAWQALARLRSGGVPDLTGIEQAAADRARPELAARLRHSAFAAAGNAEWAQAATALAAADRIVPHSYPSLLEMVLFGLGGERDRAINALLDACRDDPADRRLTHALAVMLLHTSSADDPPKAASWPLCVGAWMALLHDDVFWTDWLAHARERYAAAVPEDADATAREALRSLLESRMPGTPALGATPEVLLRRENLAASELADLGGLALAATGEPVICGPLWIAEMRLHEELGRLIGALGVSPRSDHLALLYTQLGLAIAELAAGRQASARELAMDLRCPTCRTKKPTSKSRPLLCRPGCPDVARYNPGIAAEPFDEDDLAEAATTVAIEATLELSRGLVSAPKPDVAELAKLWRDALTMSAPYGEDDVTGGIIAEIAIGRASSLRRRKDYDAAIDLLATAAKQLRSGEGHGLVVEELAQIYTDRGINTVNSDKNKLSTGYADLLEALKLNPSLLRALINAAIVAIARGHRAIDTRDISVTVLTEAVMRWREAAAHCERGLVLYPGHGELTELLDVSTENVSQAMRVLAKVGGSW